MNFRERIEQRRENPVSVVSENNNEQENTFDTDYFGIANLRDHTPCLDLRLADGSRKALPYSYIMEINFDVDNGIEIITSTKQVKITGRNLGRLYEYMATYRVRYIQAHIGTDGNELGIFVKDIEITEC